MIDDREIIFLLHMIKMIEQNNVLKWLSTVFIHRVFWKGSTHRWGGLFFILYIFFHIVSSCQESEMKWGLALAKQSSICRGRIPKAMEEIFSMVLSSCFLVICWWLVPGPPPTTHPPTWSEDAKVPLTKWGCYLHSSPSSLDYSKYLYGVHATRQLLYRIVWGLMTSKFCPCLIQKQFPLEFFPSVVGWICRCETLRYGGRLALKPAVALVSPLTLVLHPWTCIHSGIRYAKVRVGLVVININWWMELPAFSPELEDWLKRSCMGTWCSDFCPAFF
jgi:hypothetical protein